MLPCAPKRLRSIMRLDRGPWSALWGRFGPLLAVSGAFCGGTSLPPPPPRWGQAGGLVGEQPGGGNQVAGRPPLSGGSRTRGQILFVTCCLLLSLWGEGCRHTCSPFPLTPPGMARAGVGQGQGCGTKPTRSVMQISHQYPECPPLPGGLNESYPFHVCRKGLEAIL